MSPSASSRTSPTEAGPRDHHRHVAGLVAGPPARGVRPGRLRGHRGVGARAVRGAAGRARRGPRALAHATRAMAPGQDLRAGVELYRILRRLRPDIVHTHNPKPGWWGRPAARLARVPVVVNTVHGLYAAPDDPWPRRALVYGLERAAATCSRGELVQNPEDVATLERLRVPRSAAAPAGQRHRSGALRPGPARRGRASGRGPPRSSGAGPDDVVVGVVARLVEEKGIAEVLAAAGRRPGPGPGSALGADRPRRAGQVRRGLDLAALGRRSRTRRGGAGPARRRGGPLRRDGPVRPGLAPRRVPPRRHGGGRHGPARGGHRHPRLPPGGRRRRHRPAGAGRRRAGAGPGGGRPGRAPPTVRRAMGRAGRAKAAREFDQRRCIDITLALYRELLADA